MRPDTSPMLPSRTLVTTEDQAISFVHLFPDGVHRPMSCPNHGSFITWLSGESFVKAALCLRRQLTRVQTTCPLLLLYEDATISAAAHVQLEQAYGPSSLIPISALAANLARTTSFVGRRLFQSITQTLPKLWIWALPPTQYPLLLYLDIDVLITENIDDVLAYKFSTPVAAVPCPHGMWEEKAIRFNAGVLLLKPNLNWHAILLRLARFSNYPWSGYVPRAKLVTLMNETRMWYDICAPDDGCREQSCLEARRLFPQASEPLKACRLAHNASFAFRIPKACATKIGDQSIHNSGRPPPFASQTCPATLRPLWDLFRTLVYLVSFCFTPNLRHSTALLNPTSNLHLSRQRFGTKCRRGGTGGPHLVRWGSTWMRAGWRISRAHGSSISLASRSHGTPCMMCTQGRQKSSLRCRRMCCRGMPRG